MDKNKNTTAANGTQDANKPIDGTRTETVTTQLTVRTIDRTPKNRAVLRAAHIAAEAVYYPNLSRLLDVYEDVLLDLWLSGIIRKRISQVVNKKMSFIRNGEPVEATNKTIRSKVFKDIMRQILWTKMWGLNGLEFIPGEKLAFNLIPKKHIKRKTQKITFEQTGLDEGIDYTELKNIWILGDPHDLGLLLMCSYLVLLKKDAISDWAQYIQLFGSPIMVLKYKGFDMSAKAAADDILKKLQSAARITIPEEMGLTFEDGKMANGTGELQNVFRQAVNEELSIALLGNTETTGHSGTGTGAKSQTHSQQQLEIIKDDMDDLLDALNSEHFMNILKSYNIDVEGGEFVFDKEVDVDYLKNFMPVVVQAGTQLGLPISKAWLYDLTGMPAPKDADDAITLYPTLGQQPTDNEPDTEDGTPAPARKPKAKPKPQALLDDPGRIATIADVKAMLTDFFGPAL